MEGARQRATGPTHGQLGGWRGEVTGSSWGNRCAASLHPCFIESAKLSCSHTLMQPPPCGDEVKSGL